jgi:hypothetical protein
MFLLLIVNSTKNHTCLRDIVALLLLCVMYGDAICGQGSTDKIR